MKSMERMKELITLLNEASKAYYAEDREIMSNFEYDALYDELVALEEELGTVLSNSPTVNVGYEAVEELPKERHETTMLSLGKTKDREELRDWLLDKEGILSWKLDGLTVVLTYEAGELKKAVTRGNGEVGEVVTNNARVFKNLPHRIPYQGKLVLRGEAVIKYSDFEKINAQIENDEDKYKNPRNLCSGSIRQLNNEITASRNVHFYAFSFVSAIDENGEYDFSNSKEAQFLFLKEQGFEIVEYKMVNRDTILEAIEGFEKAIQTFDIPSDGLVLTFEDIAYGKSLGRTAKFPRDSIAFKWQDEVKATTLLEIEWSPSRTGLINPVAIFEPIELEGTTVSRASVHNVSVLRGLKLGIGDMVTVYKANMIIPQIAENLTCSDSVELPKFCPVCGGATKVQQMNDTQSLYCMNPDCDAKKVKAFAHFVNRDALNIDGLSEATLEKFLGKGFLHSFCDLFHMDRYEEDITSMEGFGEKSYKKLITAVEEARHTSLPRVIYALGITGIGLANAKVICREFAFDIDAMLAADVERLSQIDGVGEVLAGAFYSYFADEKNVEQFKALLSELDLENVQSARSNDKVNGKIFVITGSLQHFENRDALKAKIESLGGKVTGSVTGKTDALINNDITSTSSKNKKAAQLNIPVITEEMFIAEYLGE